MGHIAKSRRERATCYGARSAAIGATGGMRLTRAHVAAAEHGGTSAIGFMIHQTESRYGRWARGTGSVLPQRPFAVPRQYKQVNKLAK